MEVVAKNSFRNDYGFNPQKRQNAKGLRTYVVLDTFMGEECAVGGLTSEVP